MQGWKEAECPGLAARSNSGAHRVRLRIFSLCVTTIVGSTVTMVLSGCSSDNTVPPPEPIVSVETAPVKAQSITDMVTAEGVLYPVHQASIAPKITAPVRRFYVQRGDKVHRGQLLAVLENKDLTAAVVSAQGGYDQAQATYGSTTSSALPEEIQTANLNVVNTKTDLAAQQKLYDSENNLYKQGALARKQLDATAVVLTAAQSAYETAEKHLQNLQAEGVSQQKKAAQGQLETARGQYLGAAAQLDYTEIRSPIDGVVASRAVYPGDIAPAGTPLLVVMDISKIIVQLHIPQQQAELLQAGSGGDAARSGTRRRCSCHSDRVESRARSQQHDRRSVGAGRQSQGQVDTGNDGSSFDHGQDDRERAGHSFGCNFDRSRRKNFCDGGEVGQSRLYAGCEDGNTARSVDPGSERAPGRRAGHRQRAIWIAG